MSRCLVVVWMQLALLTFRRQYQPNDLNIPTGTIDGCDPYSYDSVISAMSSGS